MRSHRSFHNKQMLSVIGEVLLNIGSIEYSLSCGIPRLQSYFGMPVNYCYQKPKIPSLGEQKEPCLKLRDRVSGHVSDDVSIYAKVIKTINIYDEGSTQAMSDFVELADNTEIVYLELNVILKLIDGLREIRNDLLHSTKLESEDGLIVTTADKPARIITSKELALSLRKSRQALQVSSSLLVVGVFMAAEGDKLYSSLSNGSHNSRFLKKLYRDNINDLGSKWRNHLMAS